MLFKSPVVWKIAHKNNRIYQKHMIWENLCNIATRTLSDWLLKILKQTKDILTVKNTHYIIRSSLESNNHLMLVWWKVWEERIANSELLRQRQNGQYTINSSKLHCVMKEWQMDGILCSRHTFIIYDTKQQ